MMDINVLQNTLTQLELDSMKKGCKRKFKVMGYSMRNTMNIDDIIYVEYKEGDNYSKNDIILFRKEGKLIAHRIISSKINKNNNVFYQTKGDGNLKKDYFILEPDEIFGKVKVIYGRKRIINLDKTSGLIYDCFIRLFSGIRVYIIAAVKLCGITVKSLIETVMPEKGYTKNNELNWHSYNGQRMPDMIIGNS